MATFTVPPFTGGPEDDVFRPTAAHDAIRGGGGTDVVDYSAAGEGVEVNLESGRGMFGLADNDSYTGIEDVIGSEFNDRLIGRSSVNTLRGGDGDDDLYGAGGDDVLVGGAGDDTLGRIDDGSDRNVDPDFTDDAGDDTMMGNAGVDTLYGGPGNDRLMGGRDDDEVRGDAGNDMLWGGAGNDMLYGGDGNDTAWGGAGADRAWGEAGADMLWGNAGDDTLMGGAGNDMLGGGRDNDTVLGEAGEDTLWGGAGDDTVYGGAGADTIEGGAGADELYGGSRDAQGMHVADNAGDDSLLRVKDTSVPPDGVLDPNPDGNTVSYAGSNAAVTIDLRDADPGTPGTQMTASGGHAAGDVLVDFQSIRGSAHGDRLTGDDNRNFIRGHGGDDVIKGGGSPASLELTYPAPTADNPSATETYQVPANNLMDVLWGGAGDDDIDGEGGPDDIIGGPGDDVLQGGPGDDTLEGGAGTDTIDGGADGDTLSFANAAAGVTVDLSEDADADGYRMIEGDRVKGVEIYRGSPHGDTFTESATGGDMFMGGAGDDMFMSGAAAPSTYTGGPGDDTYVINPIGSAAIGDNVVEEEDGGTDTIRFTGRTDTGASQSIGVFGGVITNLPDNVENGIALGDTNDNLGGNALDNMLSTGDGTDQAIGREGNDTIDLGDGNDRGEGREGNDTIRGGAGRDTLEGGSGHDVLDGGADNDTIDGGAGDDTIDGGAGDDTIDGGFGGGNNVINGGAGADIITFGVGDTVTGGPGADHFNVRGTVGDEDSDLIWTITDFSTRDQIDVTGLGIDGAEMGAALDAAEQIGDDLRITFPDTASPLFTAESVLVLKGVDLDDLTHGTSGSDVEFLTS